MAEKVGLQAIERLAGAPDELGIGRFLPALESARPIGERIAGFWLDAANRRSPTWRDHRDINEVMLATALLRAQVGTALAPRSPRELTFLREQGR